MWADSSVSGRVTGALECPTMQYETTLQYTVVRASHTHQRLAPVSTHDTKEPNPSDWTRTVN